MNKRIRIKRLERLSTDERPLCTHAFTLILDGQMIQDDPACAACAGERITLVAVHESEGGLETATRLERILTGAKSV